MRCFFRRVAVTLSLLWIGALFVGLLLPACGDSRSDRRPVSPGPERGSEAASQEKEKENEQQESEEEPTLEDSSDAELAEKIGPWRPAFQKLVMMTDRLRGQHFLPDDRKVRPTAGAMGDGLARQIGMSSRFFASNLGDFQPNHFVLESFDSTARFTFRIEKRDPWASSDDGEVLRYSADSTNVRWELPPALAEAKERAQTSREPGFDWLKISFGREVLQRTRFAIQGYLDNARRNNRDVRISSTMPMRDIFSRTRTGHLGATAFYGVEQFALAEFDETSFAFRVVIRTDDRESNPSRRLVLDSVARPNWWHGDPPQVSGNGENESNRAGVEDDPQPDPSLDRPNGGDSGSGSRPDPGSGVGEIPDNLPEPVVWIEVTGQLEASEHWPEDYEFDGEPLVEAIAEMLREEGYRIAASEQQANAILRASCALSLPRAPHTFLDSVTRVPVVPAVDFEYEDHRREHGPLTTRDMGGRVNATSWEGLFAEVGRSIAERNRDLITARFPRN